MNAFSTMSTKEKVDTIRNIQPYLDDTAAGMTFYQKILAQGLFVTRVQTFFAELLAMLDKPVPSLMTDAVEQLWRWLAGEAADTAAFHQAAESVLLYLLVDDDDGLDQAAWEKYRREWDDSLLYNTCLESATGAMDVLGQAVRGEITWYELTEAELPASIAHFIADFALEPVFRKADGCYSASKADRAERDMYDCPTFGRVMDRLLVDIETARGVTDRAGAAALRGSCGSIFDSRQTGRIASALRESYRL